MTLPELSKQIEVFIKENPELLNVPVVLNASGAIYDLYDLSDTPIAIFDKVGVGYEYNGERVKEQKLLLLLD